jgi:hypothetical protein
VWLCGMLNRQRHSLCAVNLKWGHPKRLTSARLTARVRNAEKESSRVHCAISLSASLYFSYLISSKLRQQQQQQRTGRVTRSDHQSSSHLATRNINTSSSVQNSETTGIEQNYHSTIPFHHTTLDHNVQIPQRYACQVWSFLAYHYPAS